MDLKGIVLVNICGLIRCAEIDTCRHGRGKKCHLEAEAEADDPIKVVYDPDTKPSDL